MKRVMERELTDIIEEEKYVSLILHILPLLLYIIGSERHGWVTQRKSSVPALVCLHYTSLIILCSLPLYSFDWFQLPMNHKA